MCEGEPVTHGREVGWGVTAQTQETEMREAETERGDLCVKERRQSNGSIAHTNYNNNSSGFGYNSSGVVCDEQCATLV